MKRTLLCLLLCLPVVAGCQPADPAARLVVARETFNATVNALAAHREAGAFTERQARDITEMVHAGQDTLDRWQAAIELGQEPGREIAYFNMALRELAAQRIAAQRQGAQP